MRREASAYQVSHTKIPVNGLEKPIKILHLSDFHASEDVSFDQIHKAIQIARESTDPDLVCLTGDYMTTDFPDRSNFIETFSSITDIAPTIAIIGNHDFTRNPHGSVTFRPMLDLLRSCNFKTLFNEKLSLDIQGQQIEIVGLGDIWSGTCRPQRVINTMDEKSEPRPPRIVLSHNPDSKATLQRYDWDLMLCGHTHGGQLKIPFTDIRPILPIRDKAYSSGLYDWDQRKIFITRGVGNQHGLRFNCPPELSLIHLIPQIS